jgi:hypothetical protein
MTDFKQYIEKYEALLPVGTSISFTEAERRAGEFLSAAAMITNFRHMLGNEKIKFTTVQTAVFATEMSKGTAKTMTENKMIAESSVAYTLSREELERVENDMSYLKAYYDIFMSAHVFYRQMARGENV